MSHLLNKLLGREDETTSHSQTSNVKSEGGTCSDSKSGGTCNTSTCSDSKSGGTCNSGLVVEGKSTQYGGVNIKSTVSSDTSSTVSLANQQKLNDLISKLGATHSQIDEYARLQTAKINDEIQREIDQVVVRTRTDQEGLLSKANEHTAQIDAEYRAQLQKMVEKVDADKAKRIAEIEKELNDKQAAILQGARNEIDALNKKAANLKIGVLEQAQTKAATDANAITAQAAHLGQSSTVHQSVGTTTIKTEVSAATTTKDASAASATTARNAGGSTVTTATTKEVRGSK